MAGIGKHTEKQCCSLFKKISWHLPLTGTEQEKLSNRITDLQVESQKIKGVNQTHS
jgi:hypothetical protein